MMECSNCGVEVEDEANFCGQCGTSLQQEAVDTIAKDQEIEVNDVIKKNEISKENRKESNEEELNEKEFVDVNVCPHCGSRNTKKESRLKEFFSGVAMILFFTWIPVLGWIIGILGLMMIFMSIFGDMDYKCKKCNETYDPKEIEV